MIYPQVIFVESVYNLLAPILSVSATAFHKIATILAISSVESSVNSTFTPSVSVMLFCCLLQHFL